MNYRECFAAIKKGQFENVYFLYGAEEHIRASIIDGLQKAMLPAGLEMLNLVTLEDPTVRDIQECCETLPMMSDWRFVLVRNLGLLSGDKGGEEAAQQFTAYLAKMPKQTCLCIDGGESVDKRRKLAKALLALPGAVECAPLGEEELIRWIAQQLAKAGKQIDRQAAQQMIYLCGRDLTRLTGEIDKCIAYVGTSDKIYAADVEAAVTHSSEAQIFDMTNALFEGQYGKAAAMLNMLLEAGETRIGILALLTAQVRRFLYIRTMQRERLSFDEMGKILGVSPYACRMSAQRLGKRTEKELQELLDLCVSADYDIKRGEIRDDAALDRLLLYIAGGTAGTNAAAGRAG